MERKIGWALLIIGILALTWVSASEVPEIQQLVPIALLAWTPWTLGIASAALVLSSLGLTIWVAGYKRGREDQRLKKPDRW